MRLHLFEIEDQPWWPRILRDYATDFLQFVLHVGDNYAHAAPLMEAEMEAYGERRIVDLCSGGGGPWKRLLPGLRASGPVDLRLTDLYPNANGTRRLAKMGARYHRESVDARSVPSSLRGLRTIFSGFHHFRPKRLDTCWRMRSRRVPIAVFEITQRRLRALLMILFSPFLVLVSTPFIRPFRLTRLLFTYLIPIVPLFILWDGVRFDSQDLHPREMARIDRDVAGGDRYEWRTAEVRGQGPLPMTYLIGRPRR